MAVLNFRNHSYKAAKAFWPGTHRIVSLEKTWEKVSPYFKSIGLTRIGNITGLDWIGIPVTISYRPNSASVVTSSGKGTTIEAAMVAAAMESTELYCAENIDLPVISLPYVQLSQKYRAISPENLPLGEYSLFNVNRTEQWCLGWDVVNQHEVAVPVQAVSMNYHKLWYKDFSSFGSFEMGSNGLASGNHFLEAVSSALLELIERDAISCQLEAVWQDYGMPQGYQMPKVRLETITYPTILELLAKLKAAKVNPFLFDCTVDTEIPVYRAYIHDPSGSGPSSHGYGAHLDPEIAMIRALTEAAQTRLIVISGARDDIYHQYYRALQLKGNGSYEARNLELIPETVDAQLRKSQATPSLEEDIGIVLEKLKQIGLKQVIVFDLTPPNWDVFVARVIVPGLEASFHRSYQPRQRAIAFAQKKCQTQFDVKNQARHEAETHRPAGGVI
ncbi:MAG: YcaO-like family protein [Coleofasciculaceae cyanobacterium]